MPGSCRFRRLARISNRAIRYCPALNTVYCRRCGSEGIVSRVGNRIYEVAPTGRKGTPTDLQPEADLDLIGDLVQDAARFVLIQGSEASA